MASEKTFIRLTTEMITKSVFSLPLSIISLVSSYFTIEEPMLRSPYIIQTPYLDTPDHVNENKDDLQYHVSEQNHQDESNTTNSNNRVNVDKIFVDIGNGSKIPLTTWKDSLLACLDHLIESEKFTLKIKTRFTHKTDAVGNVPVYDLTFCNSDYFCIPGELLEKSLKEMSKRVGEGNHMDNSYAWAFCYIYNKSENCNIMGNFCSNPINGFDKENNGSDSDDNDDVNGNDDNNNIREEKGNINLGQNTEHEKNESQKNDEIKKKLRYKKVTARPCYLHEVIDNVDEEEKLCPIITKDTIGCSCDVHFLDENCLVDSNIDRSYLATAGIINLLIYFDCIINNLKAVTPNRPLLPENFDEDSSISPEEKEKIRKLFSSKISDFPNSNVKLRDDIHTMVQDKDKHAYHVYTYTKEISDVIGVWGRDDLYLTYISYIRKLSLVPGFDKIKETMYDNNQGSYGGYMNPENNDRSNTEQRKENNSTSSSSKDSKSPTELWDKEIKMMKEERDIYCESVELAVTSLFKTVSGFVRNIDTKYKTMLESNVNNKNIKDNKISEFYDKKKFMDYINSENVTFENQEQFNEAYERFVSNKHKAKKSEKFIYKGSKDYEDLKMFYSDLTKTFISMMDDKGILPYYQYDDKKPRTFSDYYQVHKILKPFEFCDLVKNLDKTDILNDEMLKETNLGDYYHYEFMELQVGNYYGNYPVLCLYGIPEAILYDEMATFKWLSTLWKMKTDTESKAFLKKSNKFSDKGLLFMCSKLWQAKSIISMTEYKNVALRFNKYFFNDTIFRNSVPADKRRTVKRKVKKMKKEKQEYNFSKKVDDKKSEKNEKIGENDGDDENVSDESLEDEDGDSISKSDDDDDE